jgi:hypothetical protein
METNTKRIRKQISERQMVESVSAYDPSHRSMVPESLQTAEARVLATCTSAEREQYWAEEVAGVDSGYDYMGCN